MVTVRLVWWLFGCRGNPGPAVHTLHGARPPWHQTRECLPVLAGERWIGERGAVVVRLRGNDNSGSLLADQQSYLQDWWLSYYRNSLFSSNKYSCRTFLYKIIFVQTELIKYFSTSCVRRIIIFLKSNNKSENSPANRGQSSHNR